MGMEVGVLLGLGVGVSVGAGVLVGLALDVGSGAGVRVAVGMIVAVGTGVGELACSASTVSSTLEVGTETFSTGDLEPGASADRGKEHPAKSAAMSNAQLRTADRRQSRLVDTGSDGTVEFAR